MWSLPNIRNMNARARGNRDSLTQASQTGELNGEKLGCEHCDTKEGLNIYPWYDIFSDDPKGVLALCEKHDGYYGSPDEGYFTCDDCGRVFIENYTWERYCHEEDGEVLCLNCYAKRVIGDKDHPAWVRLTDKNIESLDFGRVRHAPHIIAVEGPKHGLKFHGNVEFDNTDGHCISGGGLDEIKETLRKVRSKGHKRALLVLDAAYQFAVSVGVYTNGRG